MLPLLRAKIQCKKFLCSRPITCRDSTKRKRGKGNRDAGEPGRTRQTPCLARLEYASLFPRQGGLYASHDRAKTRYAVFTSKAHSGSDRLFFSSMSDADRRTSSCYKCALPVLTYADGIALSQILPARKNKSLELELQLPATGFLVKRIFISYTSSSVP